MKTPESVAFLLAVHRAMPLTKRRFTILEEAFGGDFEAVFTANATAIERTKLDPRGKKALLENREKTDPDTIVRELNACGARVLVYNAPEYPEPLRHINAPPMVLFVCGELRPTDFPMLGVVGSRRLSSYGAQALEHIVRPIASRGVTIVSGLALGADAAAHSVALEAGARTVAVLGNGVDSVYPRTNVRLGNRILEHGAILSEYFPGTDPRPEHFPVRNRIVAGLARGVLVAEATDRSGSLITARLAGEFGKEVFAIPGDIFRPGSMGTNTLIEKGMATPALSAEQILESLQISKKEGAQPLQTTLAVSPEEQAVLAAFQNDLRCHVNDLIRNANAPAATVTSCLALLEIKGMVRHEGAQMYMKTL